MTITEFIELNPSAFSEYGNNKGNVNILISSSVSGSDDIPVAPFHIQGITFPFFSIEGTGLTNPLKEVTELKFNYAGETRTAEVLDRQQKPTHMYFRIKDIILNTTSSISDEEGIPVERTEEFVFIPYNAVSFNNNDYNPLISNADDLKKNAIAMEVDRVTSQILPTNLDAIIDGTAKEAQIQNCSYTKAGIINARYVGSKLDSGSIEGDDPALSFREFKGSEHPSDSDITTVKNIQLSDRDVVEVYFTPKRIEAAGEFSIQSFPASGSILYREENNRFIRIVNTKVYSVDKNQIYSTDELGKVATVA